MRFRAPALHCTADAREPRGRCFQSDWARLSRVSHQQLGMRIFLRIFELEPSTKNSFPELVDLTGDELMAKLDTRTAP